jgi:phage terminase large subunit-like protein
MGRKKRIAKEFEKLSEIEKYNIADAIYHNVYPEYEHRQAKNIKEFVRSEFYLNAKECWDTILDILISFYDSKKHIGVFIMPPGCGKSYLSSIIASYEVHKLLCFKNPQKVLNLAEGSNIAIMNMSQNGLQARKVVFSEIKARIDNSFWFKNFCPPNPEKRSELEFKKNIFIIPGNSEETNPFGYNLVVVIMDEVAWWEKTQEKDYLKDTFETLEKRLNNRYGNNYNWKIVLISNPSYPDNYIESLIDRPDVFGVRKKLWEIKPWFFVNEEFVDWQGYKIPKSLFVEAEKNPDVFKRDILAVPTETIRPWLANPEMLKNVILESLKNPVEKEQILWNKLEKTKKNIYIHVDLGLTNDACGLCAVYKENNIIKPLLIYRMQGSQQNPIKFSEVRQIILQLKEKGYNIKKISYDGFQSIDSIQILQSQGLQVELLSVDKNPQPYDTLRELIYDRKIVLPYINWEKINFCVENPEEYLIKELRYLEKRKEKVDHPPKGSKDVADALAGATYWCIQEPEENVVFEKDIQFSGVELESSHFFEFT